MGICISSEYLSEAHSRLYRSRFLQLKAHVAVVLSYNSYLVRFSIEKVIHILKPLQTQDIKPNVHNVLHYVFQNVALCCKGV